MGEDGEVCPNNAPSRAITSIRLELIRGGTAYIIGGLVDVARELGGHGQRSIKRRLFGDNEDQSIEGTKQEEKNGELAIVSNAVDDVSAAGPL